MASYVDLAYEQDVRMDDRFGVYWRIWRWEGAISNVEGEYVDCSAGKAE